MSNAVDVLLVGGPKNGSMLCVPRPVVNIPVDAGQLQGDPEYIYNVQAWTDPLSGKRYWIGTRENDPPPNDSVVTVLILVQQMPPSWDLNP
ncbi:MAG TPA: hypothetical protein VF680_17570 [Allosphingosinicella sp.]|jgi:hypothetical protein